MPTEVLMPSMGADMEEGTVVRWLKQAGEPVRRGDAIAEIETDKATVELEAFEDGVFARAVVAEGAKVPVATVIAYLAQPGEPLDAAPTASLPITSLPERGEAGSVGARHASPNARPGDTPGPRASSPPPAGETPALPGAQATPGLPAGRPRASPLARRLAAELGVDLGTLHGTGPDGRIVRRDVEAAAHRTPAPERTQPATEAATAPLSRMRQAIARSMADSKRQAPHYYITIDVDMSDAMDSRRRLNEAGGDDLHITVNDLLVKAAAVAIAKYPAFNASYSDPGLVSHEQINICIGVALEEGLIAPALLDCGRKSLGMIAREARDLSRRARSGNLRPAELSEGTFTISNLGAYGVETLIAIIQPPQSAIIGAGTVQSRPVVRDGQIVAREMLKLTLSADHRVTDGAQGAEFMRELKAILEQPLRLAL